MASLIFIDGIEIPQAEVEAWERRRVAAVSRQFGFGPLGLAGELAVQSSRLAETKRSLGYEAIVRRLRRSLAASSASTKLLNTLSFARRRICVTEMLVDGASAVEITHGFERLMSEPTAEHDLVNLGACPDHYVIRPVGSGRLEVIETTGGSPLPLQFFVEVGAEAGLAIPRDSSYPHQSAGVARLGDGTAIGGVRHQLRDEGGGFRARLAVEFPWLTPGYLIRQHQFHLACEFGNWFRWLLEQKRAEDGCSRR